MLAWMSRTGPGGAFVASYGPTARDAIAAPFGSLRACIPSMIRGRPASYTTGAP